MFPGFVADVDGPALYRDDLRPAPSGRPWVAINMVATVDGAITLDGRSGGLSGPADKAVFFALRSVADVILVGAGTVRAEHYGPPRTSAEDQDRRVQRGQAPFPTIAVVSGRMDLAPDARLFRDTPVRPVILTTEGADSSRRAALEPVADVVTVGHGSVDFRLGLSELHQRGAEVVVCEGGPTLNGGLAQADLVDELCVTISPLLTSGDDLRMIRGAPLAPPRGVALDRQLLDDGFVFSRYLVRR